MVELRGDVVTLRPFRADELDRVWAERLASPYAVGRANRERFQERFEHSGEWHDGVLDLAIEAGGRLVGEIGARAPERLHPEGVCELGIELFPGERGAGRGTDAIRLLSGWLLEHGYPRVQASTDVRNAPMRRVFEKLGWQLEGVMRSFMPDGDGRADYALYAITR